MPGQHPNPPRAAPGDKRSDPLVSIQDVLWVLAQVTAGVLDDAQHLSGPQLTRLAFGLPMHLTVRLPRGSHVTCFFVPGIVQDICRIER